MEAASSSAANEMNHNFEQRPLMPSQPPPQSSSSNKRKRNQPRDPNPDAEVVALSPKSLMATNRFVCEVCNKGFQREQNLQLHRRGHNLPWKLQRQKSSKEVRRKVYLCPEPTCIHHDPARALGDLTGIKKHYSRKHGDKKFKCHKCCKKYAVQSDWKAHSKTCGTRDYRCDCGTVFSRRDSFITHRAFCDALAQESAHNLNPPTGGTHLLGLPQMSAPLPDHQINKLLSNQDLLRLGGIGRPTLQFEEDLSGFMPLSGPQGPPHSSPGGLFLQPEHEKSQHADAVGLLGPWNKPTTSSSFHGLMQLSGTTQMNSDGIKHNFSDSGNNASAIDGAYHLGGGEDSTHLFSSGKVMIPSLYIQQSPTPAHMSATALLQKAAQLGSTASSSLFGSIFNNNNSHLHDLVSRSTGRIMLDATNNNGSPSSTRDFLGVGETMRSVSREKHNMSALDSQGNAATSQFHSFGGN